MQSKDFVVIIYGFFFGQKNHTFLCERTKSSFQFKNSKLSVLCRSKQDSLTAQRICGVFLDLSVGPLCFNARRCTRQPNVAFVFKCLFGVKASVGFCFC